MILINLLLAFNLTILIQYSSGYLMTQPAGYEPACENLILQVKIIVDYMSRHLTFAVPEDEFFVIKSIQAFNKAANFINKEVLNIGRERINSISVNTGHPETSLYKSITAYGHDSGRISALSSETLNQSEPSNARLVRVGTALS